MRVSIVGAGALGTVYGARLATQAGCQVSIVARDAAPASLARLERIVDGEVLDWPMPARVATAPLDAEVILVFVRYEQLDALAGQVGASSAPVVVMTPMMPRDHALLSAALPGRVLTGMPGVVSYRNDAGAIRYWLPRVATTLVEDPQSATDRGGSREDGSGRDASEAPGELAKRLTRAGIGSKLAPDVLTRNVATTVSFIPLAMALDVAGGVDALLQDHALLSLAFDALDESGELGRAVGRAEPWASRLLRFAGPLTLRIGVGLARSRTPEAMTYLGRHFGRKLHVQNVAMARTMVDLAAEKGTRDESLRRLLERLERT